MPWVARPFGEIMPEVGCPGCEGVVHAGAELALARSGLIPSSTMTQASAISLVCRAPVDCTVNPAAIERGEEQFQCSRPLGHQGLHMACSIPGGWNSPPGYQSLSELLTSNPHGPLTPARHPAYVWGLDFSALKAELAWLEGEV